MNGRVFVVDDEKLRRESLLQDLRRWGLEAEAFENPYPALERLQQVGVDVIVTDLRMPSMDGLTFVQEARRLSPDTEAILMTAFASVETAVAALRQGVSDYLIKPFASEELEARLEKILAFRRTRQELSEARRLLSEKPQCHRLLGRSPLMRKVFETIEMLSGNPCTVLLTGETGTGKELAAEALHVLGPRKQGPMVKVSCAALSPTLLESELFGHEPGAFTGALRRHVGRFELANGGTIFLDDVDDVPVETQVKLNRVLEERRLTRVGGEESLPLDVRVVAATKRDLARLVREGRFREDLYYRINVAEVRLPPLRERREDILLLASHFLRRYAAAGGREPPPLSPEAAEVLLRHSWPGNVRELEHAVERAVAFSVRADRVEVSHLPGALSEGGKEAGSGIVTLNLADRSQVDMEEVLRETEARLVDWALERSAGNQGQAAEMLGLARTTFRDRLTRVRPSPPQPPAKDPEPKPE